MLTFVLAYILAPLDQDQPRPPSALGQDRESPTKRHAANPDQDDDDDEEEGRVRPDTPIVVTGRRLDEARTGTDAALGATSHSLTNDTVENRPGGETGSIADILTQAPGVGMTGNRLTVRGAVPSQVRINDVIVPEAVADPAEHLSARLAETTRLLTGALPAQFGAATGGVISVTTKNGLYQHGGQAELFAGTDGMGEPALEWAGSVEGTSLFASGSIERGRADLADPAGVPGRSQRRAVEGLAFADHVFDSENRVSLILGGSRERRRITGTGLGPGTEQAADGYAVAAIQHSAGATSVQAAVFGALATDRADFAQTTREHRTSIGTQIDATRRLSTEHTLRLGLLAARTTAQEAGGEEAARLATGLYAQDQWTLAPALTLNPGVRVEWARGFSEPAAVEPRASLVWAADEDLTVHIGYARYAVAPLLGRAESSVLRNERDDYYDAGVQAEIGHLRLGANGYWQALRDLLASREQPGSALATPFAFAHGTRRGIELFGSYARRGLVAWTNLALSRATGRTILGGDGLFAPATLAAADRAPVRLDTDRPFTASGGATRRYGKLSVSAEAEIASGTVRTDDPARPNGARGPVQVGVGLATVYHAEFADVPVDLRLDVTNLLADGHPTQAASALGGGWTVFPRQRAITFGIEAGF